MSKKEMIGLDRTYKQVHVGDTIQDAEGVKYTITERGTAVGPGGKEVQYHTIKGPELCSDEPKQEAPAAPVKKEENIFPKRRGGKENKSGLVRVGNIARAVAYHLGNGTAVLRKAGIEIVKDPATGKPCVRIKDKGAARELLASLVPPAGAVTIADITPEGPVVDFEALKEQEAEVAVRGILAQFEDKALAAELRRRGFEVTATKTVVVSL